jgi:uncharacterized protein YebE (UPF0316 family)
MIDFFIENEAFINLVCFLLMLFFVFTWDAVKVMNKKIENIVALIFGFNFGLLTLNVLLNGIVKGF